MGLFCKKITDVQISRINQFTWMCTVDDDSNFILESIRVEAQDGESISYFFEYNQLDSIGAQSSGFNFVFSGPSNVDEVIIEINCIVSNWHIATPFIYENNNWTKVAKTISYTTPNYAQYVYGNYGTGEIVIYFPAYCPVKYVTLSSYSSDSSQIQSCHIASYNTTNNSVVINYVYDESSIEDFTMTFSCQDIRGSKIYSSSQWKDSIAAIYTGA